MNREVGSVKKEDGEKRVEGLRTFSQVGGGDCLAVWVMSVVPGDGFTGDRVLPFDYCWGGGGVLKTRR